MPSLTKFKAFNVLISNKEFHGILFPKETRHSSCFMEFCTLEFFCVLHCPGKVQEARGFSERLCFKEFFISEEFVISIVLLSLAVFLEFQILLLFVSVYSPRQNLGVPWLGLERKELLVDLNFKFGKHFFNLVSLKIFVFLIFWSLNSFMCFTYISLQN